MAVRIVWSAAARADLIDIYVTIGGENMRAADRYYDWKRGPWSWLTNHAWV